MNNGKKSSQSEREGARRGAGLRNVVTFSAVPAKGNIECVLGQIHEIHLMDNDVEFQLKLIDLI